MWTRVSFFFQAEDGIRDVAVTGVQTCALPIYDAAEPACRNRQRSEDVRLYGHQWEGAAAGREFRFGGVPTLESERAARTSSNVFARSEEHTSELQSRLHLVCRLLLEKQDSLYIS